jgi:hypothetical protein
VTEDFGFSPLPPDTKLAVGLVLRRLSPSGSVVLQRITHLFERCVFVMRVSTPEEARNAQRPKRLRIVDVRAEVKAGTAKAPVLGRLPLPGELSRSVAKEESDEVAAAMRIIQPLLDSFSVEDNLSRWEFTKQINQRAEALEISDKTVKRLVLRYYYFGCERAAVGKLRPGPNIEDDARSGESGAAGGRRRGPKSRVSKSLGENRFTPSEADIYDMLESVKRCQKAGTTAWVDMHTSYLETEFAARHEKTYERLLAKKIDVPVTRRQFTSAIRKYQKFADDLLQAIPQLEGRRKVGSLQSAGPADIYELDATGGRIFLVDSKPPHDVLGKPVIYLLIDRWSRYVVSAYITLKPASFEELRYALLIAFTSRKKRFKNIGVDVTDDEWPIGVVPAYIARDRGPDMTADAATQTLVKGLHIGLLTMPPYCPDGKGIIERFIRELKRLMKRRDIPGVYGKRPMTRETKQEAKNAECAAAYTLQQMYRVLIEIIRLHNDKPHSALKKRAILKLHRVAPRPKDAFLWGLKNLTGIRRPPLTDDDYRRILRGRDKASIKNGVVTWRDRHYFPENQAADRQARMSNSRPRSIEVAVDRSYPVDLYVPMEDGTWPYWQVDAANLKRWQDMTLEEEEGLAEAHKALSAQAEHDHFTSTLRPIGKTPSTGRTRGRSGTPRQSEGVLKARRAAESHAIKRGLSGQQNPPRATKPTTPRAETWQEVEERERQAVVKRQRSRGRK